MPQFLSPIGNDQFIDANGDPLTGGQIETYLAGSSTPAATFTSSAGTTTQPQPINLNSLGYAPSPIWLTSGSAYKFVIKNASGSTLRTIDDIAGINDASVSQSEWVESGFVPSFVSATSFSVPGDQTPLLQIGRRLRTTNTSGLVYSTISNSVFAVGVTTVTVVNDSTTLDVGLSLVAYGLLAASPVSVPNLSATKLTGTVAIANGGTGQTTGAAAISALFGTRADIASAATVDLSSAVSSINITGTTTITAFTVAVGRVLLVRFNASLTLTNNASIVTQTGANILTAAGDTCVLRATAANTVEVVSYVPAVLNQQTTRSMVRLNTAGAGAAGYGSTGTAIRRFTTVVTTQGSDITYADSATAGASFTVNASGVYAISYNDSIAAAFDIGLSLNANAQTATSILSVTAANRLAISQVSATNFTAAVSCTAYLTAGDIVRPHCTNAPTAGTGACNFTMVRVA